MFGSFQIDQVSTRGRIGPVFGGFGLSGLGSELSGGHSGGGTGKFGVGSQSSNRDEASCADRLVREGARVARADRFDEVPELVRVRPVAVLEVGTRR